ncbi:hypothetical protein IW140_001641 [Coemansia sp. RSA 1813]|nr:hypothetical protein EV178_001598 [Coemansia sp. RSA 1646]KAJ1769802.1 hypothetical protein LPJ74_003717 [Coemansia sp. RSA 1843]KAJ2091266.1 hypothetical protein IW138_001965 [Coemansia sp. RSA 986]KAJ2216455.1 hypothetical protein EV179_001250 [Coemansia sp. RSA 487]KAJ2571461.1 hypothetical protein IW140_001641 [Coemansia sp. RSA 1813]
MSTGGGTDLTDEQRQHSRQQQQSAPMYWCHQCQREISPMMAPNPICPRCHGDFVEEIETENDPRDFLAGADTGNEHDQDEMENEFGGAGNYNQELQTMLQDMLSNMMGRPIPTTADGEDQTGQQRQQQPQASPADAADGNDNGNTPGSIPDNSGAGQSGTFGRSIGTAETAGSQDRRFPGLRTWTSNMGGAQVSFSVGSFSPEEFASRVSATAAGGGQRRPGNDNGDVNDQQRESGDDMRRPMFIDPEENAPLTLGTLVSSLLGALGGASRGEDGQGPGGMSQLFGVPIGNLGDYAWGQNSLDDIITNLMDQAPSANSQPPASDESITKLPRRTITASEANAKLDCGICMDEYKANEEVVELPCKHVYHKDCIEHWLKMNGTCPICRTRIETEDSKKRTSPGSPVPRPHSELPGSFPSSPGESTTTQPQQSRGERDVAPPEQEPMD